MSEHWTEEDIEERNRRVFGAPDCDLARAAAERAMSEKSEAKIEAECTKLLEEDGWRPLRTDPVSDRGRGKGFGELGMADHLYLRYDSDPLHGPGDNCRGQILWIEFKRPGEKAAKHQIAWHVRERARGALTKIAGEDFPATVQGFKDWYENSGLMWRARWW
jgi:hypothetical protein